ncbi:UDP-galactose transmembrane transporter [Aureococcus anophagefferens]|uniref:UDP-galactose transmembrane transporter n=1 Tax=Aureococcus anophagefferens TaxID=44056 RepID=A0ABR1FVC8_AURAN
MEPMLDDDEGSGAAGVAETKAPPSPARVKRSGSIGQLMNVFDDSPLDQESSTKREVLTSLGVCVAGLLLSFLVWGVLQERMLTKPYNGDYFTSSHGLMLFKCFKLFPIMVMGKVLGNKVYPTYDYVVALVIGVGIAVFSVSTEELDIGQDSIGRDRDRRRTICGVILLLFFLLFDSFTGQYQARLFNEHPDLSPYQMMFMVNTFSMVFSSWTLVHTHELYALCEFVYDHADMHIHLIVFSLASTVGQLFIFKTIKAFGPVIFAICMNTPHHPLHPALRADLRPRHHAPGMVGLLLVFSAIAYRIKRKTDADGKPSSSGPA